MTGVAEVELRRARWRRALQREAVDNVDRDDFATAGLGSRLGTPSVRMLLLPGDPEAEALTLDDELWAWIKNHQVVNIEGAQLRLGIHEVPTAHAAALVHRQGGHEAWDSYVAIHRSGAFECGLGDCGAWERRDQDGNIVRTFNLIAIVARTWALLKFGTALRDRTAVDGPFQFTVALHRTGEAVLGDVGEGWAEPQMWHNELPPCGDPHLLWHIELPNWPDENRIRELAFGVGDRLEYGWGVRQRRYLARTGHLEGRFDVRKLRE